MILDNIFTWMLGPINYLIGLLPNADSGITSTINNTLSSFRSSLGTINWFFPVDTFLQLMSIVIVIEGILLIWKIARYIIGLFTLGVTK